MTTATSKEGLAVLRRALNGAMVSGVELADQHSDGIVLVLEGEDAARVTLWVDYAGGLRVHTTAAKWKTAD